jgi:hypothetical protein
MASVAKAEGNICEGAMGDSSQSIQSITPPRTPSNAGSPGLPRTAAMGPKAFQKIADEVKVAKAEAGELNNQVSILNKSSSPEELQAVAQRINGFLHAHEWLKDDLQSSLDQIEALQQTKSGSAIV